MAAAGGSQCGYCTPGFVMSLFAEQYRPGRSAPCEVEAMAGNLCRCTGYRPIRDAALALGAAPDDRWSERLARPAPAMEAAACGAFHRPATLAECFTLMERFPEARVVAGGTDLVVESNLGGRRFPALISLEALAELREFRQTASDVEIGAGLTLSEIDTRWEGALPVWREWLRLFASPLIRNRATLGGNLATASPIGDAAPLLLALDARVRIACTRGERVLPLEEFFQGYRQTALEPGELVRSVSLPLPLPASARFFKAAKRRLDDISTVAAGFAVEVDRRGVIRSARLAYGGVARVPVRALEAEGALAGLRWNESAIHRAQDVLARTLEPISDHRGSAAYRVALAQSLFEKYWWEGSGGAGAEAAA
jgi:xanthine dehydrogenase small subunit